MRNRPPQKRPRNGYVTAPRAGRYLRTFGGEFGSGPGQINCAHNCAYAEGKLVVCDRNNSRFHIFDAETTDLLETW